jgi:hypothetical protein
MKYHNKVFSKKKTKKEEINKYKKHVLHHKTFTFHFHEKRGWITKKKI